jgi:hypothetical protein
MPSFFSPPCAATVCDAIISVIERGLLWDNYQMDNGPEFRNAKVRSEA